MKLILHLDRIIERKIIFSLEDNSALYALKELQEKLNKKHSGYCKIEITAPYKARTTGMNSQNNLIWKLITEIAKETGNEIEDVETAAKIRAVKRGYPARINPITKELVPLSMRDIDTQQASFLIDELYAIAAEYGVEIKDAKE